VAELGSSARSCALAEMLNSSRKMITPIQRMVKDNIIKPGLKETNITGSEKDRPDINARLH
jgi:hypothetical protein